MNRIRKIAEILNSKPNEQLAKALKGEIVLPIKNN